jgi:hypothetical protein
VAHDHGLQIVDHDQDAQRHATARRDAVEQAADKRLDPLMRDDHHMLL